MKHTLIILLASSVFIVSCQKNDSSNSPAGQVVVNQSTAHRSTLKDLWLTWKADVDSRSAQTDDKSTNQQVRAIFLGIDIQKMGGRDDMESIHLVSDAFEKALKTKTDPDFQELTNILEQHRFFLPSSQSK